MNQIDHLQGVWSCVSATINGKVLPEETVKQLRLTLTRDRYQTEKGTEVLFDSGYTVETSARPPRINIVGTEGALAGKEAQGIYALEGDTLTLCYTMPGKERPAGFESAAGSEAYLLVWKREKR
ncbi:MAG: TIGR03067 domain-containing protein [Verrucomicrobiota bacterium]